MTHIKWPNNPTTPVPNAPKWPDELRSPVPQELNWQNEAMLQNALLHEVLTRVETAEAKLNKVKIAVLDMRKQWVLRDLTYEDFRKVLLELEKTE